MKRNLKNEGFEEEFEEPNEEPTDFETHPDYGRGHFTTTVDDKGREMLKPIIERKSFADLLDFAKFKKAEAAKIEAVKAARAAKDREQDRPDNSRVAELFRRTKPAPEPHPKSWGERFTQWLTAPRRPPVWK